MTKSVSIIHEALEASLKTATRILNLKKVLELLLGLLNIHWAETTENERKFDPIPNPKRFLIFAPKWLPETMHYYVDCGEAQAK